MRISRLSTGLGWLMSVLLVAGCAQSPHYLQADPQISQNFPRSGSGQSVTVNVVDGRESEVLGTRSGAAMSSAVISVEAHGLIPRLQAQAEAALSQMGFNPTPQTASGRPSLTLSLEQLSYAQADDKPLVEKALLLARLRAEVTNGRSTYTGNYTAKREQSYAVKPDREANTRMVNDVLSRALDRTFNDPEVGRLLAR